MLAVALITGQLAAGLRRQADSASLKEQQTRALYEMARDLAGALTIGQVSDIVAASCMMGSLSMRLCYCPMNKTT